MADHIRSEETQPRVFISYARSDGEFAASELRILLEQCHIPLWQDRVKMEGGRDWWLQIVEALNRVEFMVVIMTPAALQSPIVRKEWRYARQQGVCVYPIKVTPDLDLSKVPRWMSSVHWYDLEHERTKFLNDLNRPYEKNYVPFTVGNLPSDYVLRLREFSLLRKKLLDEAREEPNVITVALHGAGGYGKTTIARALCHDEGIKQAFDDGILWVTLGEQPSSLIGILGDLIYTLSHEKSTLDTLEAATNHLSELLADRDILLVIDDVWDSTHLKPFLQGGSCCARLITTRNKLVLPSEAECITVDAMQVSEAVDLLRTGLPGTDERALQLLAKRLGEWPLLLKLVNGTLRDRVRSGESFPAALAFVNDALDEEGLIIFDDEDAQDRHRAVARTIGISLQHLTPIERGRYWELAIFPEDVDIPLATLQRFWQHTGGMSRIKTELFCQHLTQLSLLLEYDLARRTVRLHDVLRAYLRRIVGSTLCDLNRQFLAAYHLSRWSDLSLNETYLWTYLAEHLVDGRSTDALLAIVRDGNYLATKTHLQGAYAVELDLALAEQHTPSNASLSHLKRLFSGISHLLNECTTWHELASTLHAHLSSAEFVEICASLENRLMRSFITAWHPLPDQPPPVLIRTLHGHTDDVNGCAISPGGEWIVSCSDDKTLKIWNAHSGQICQTLRGHSSVITGCAVSPNGEWIVSCSWDQTLKIWNVHNGQLRQTLQGHSDGVSGCAVSPDGEWIVSCSWDQTLKVWNAHSGQECQTLRGHTNGVTGCAISPNGEWFVSCSDDGTLKIWDLHNGQIRQTLRGHSDVVRGCAVSPDGEWIVSCSDDGTLKLWNVRNGQVLLSLPAHTERISGCAVSPDGEWIVSCSWDKTLKLWDVHNGHEYLTLRGHSNIARGCAVSPDGEWIVSCSWDKTLKLWDTRSKWERQKLEGHTKKVSGCAVSPDGEWIVSCSWDKTLKLWDVHNGHEYLNLSAHTERISGCAVSPDGEWIVSCSWDKTLKLWHIHNGQEYLALQGHTERVNGCAVSPDGQQIVSCSDDRTLRIWNAHNGQEYLALRGHTERVNGCVVSPDGQSIVSCSDDGTLKLWDVRSGQERLTLRGHIGSVNGCAVSPDGEWIASCSDDRTLKLWDVRNGQERLTLRSHIGSVNGCAVSPDGEWIISCSDDGTLKLWDTYTGVLRASVRVDARLKTCAFFPNGEHIVASGESDVYFLRAVW